MIPPTLDHLVYATPDLQAGIERVEALLGVRAAPGGQHQGLGTRNALIALGPSSYFEIVGPDPDQPQPDQPRWFQIDDLAAPKLVAWAATSDDLDRLVRAASARGVVLGGLRSGGRRAADGARLSWRVTDPRTVVADGIVPFFIDWGASPHPAGAASRGATLAGFRAEHPEPERVGAILCGLGLEVAITKGRAPALVATIACPRGQVEVR